MTSQFFRAPGFFDREIDLTATSQEPTGVPAGVIGAAEMGPAFVPRTVGSFSDFQTMFGTLNPNLPAPYAVDKFLDNRNALTFVRVLGGGSNDTFEDIETTRLTGTVKNAGFAVSGTIAASSRIEGAPQFIVARHEVTASEAYGYPIFSNNDSYFTTGSADEVFLVRGVVFAASGARVNVISYNDTFSEGQDSYGNVNPDDKYFKISISSSLGAPFGTTDGFPGVRILTASLDPASDNYFAKLLNTDPSKFAEEQHYVYADYAVDNSIASVSTESGSVGIAVGSLNTSDTSGDTEMEFLEVFGRFDTRYTTPATSWIISQPFGTTEYDLFRFETISDGAYANDKFKISIAALQKSSNPKYDFGSFTVLVRAFDDTDTEPKIIEQFNNVNLDPASDNYIARIIGDKRAFFNFDVEDPEDRRVVVRGKFANRSKYIRVVMNEELERGNIPKTSLPFGFRGQEVLNTNPMLVDATGSADFTNLERLAIVGTPYERMTAAIIPPVPHVFKVTRGTIDTAGTFIGSPGPTEIADSRFYWGIKFGITSNVLNPNVSTRVNSFVRSITRFGGISKLDALVTGSYADQFNSNKFSLAKVALNATQVSDLTGSVPSIMREAAYVRNGKPDGTFYTIEDNGVDRITLATLVQKGSVSDFNRFTDFTKFTTVFYGGYDGVNILDKNARIFNDRATSSESRGSVFGGNNVSFVSPGLATNQCGLGLQNSTIRAYRAAIDIITDPIVSNVNLVAIPGQREAFVTNYCLDRVSDYGAAFYAMDIPNYTPDDERIFDGDTGQYIDVENTADRFEGRALDNFYGGAYFPNYVQFDDVNNLRVTVPASVAAVAALGFNDRVSYPWFAPAGFNRAALDFVERTQVKIRQSERERLYAVKINPIVKFPQESHVIMAQNTLQLEESALNSINVQRMISDVKRQVVEIGNKIIFEQMDESLRTEFRKSLINALSVIQVKQGIERFMVICDNTNNTPGDIENNRMNAQIRLVPTRAIEFIAIDFIITRSGVAFV